MKLNVLAFCSLLTIAASTLKTKHTRFARFVFLLLGLSFFSSPLIACQCPLTQLSLEECNKYEVIFKGKIVKVIECDNKFGEVLFEVQELYKGNSEEKFKVLFECEVDCAQKFSVGDEWIIYSRYKQLDNAMMDWCSRSRKFFKVDTEDFYTYTYGNDYEDELVFLRKNLGLHRTLVERKSQIDGRNIKPSINQTIFVLLISVGTIVLFYYLFNKFLR
jgi:hypothetical protein